MAFKLFCVFDGLQQSNTIFLTKCLGNFSRLEVVAAAVLDVDDFDILVGFGHAVHEAVAAVLAGAGDLVVRDQGHFTFVADHRGHLVGRQRGRGLGVGGGEGRGDCWAG